MKSSARALSAGVAALAFSALLLAPAASALQFGIVNESGYEDDEVFVTVVAGGAYDVPGMTNDEPEAERNPRRRNRGQHLVSGRVYISYGAGVREGVPFDSPTRFDWAEMTVTPVAERRRQPDRGRPVRDRDAPRHLRRLPAATWKRSAPPTRTRSSPRCRRSPAARRRRSRPERPDPARALAAALHRLPGPRRIRALDEPARRYPLRTAFFGKPFTTTHYSGTFAADGSIILQRDDQPRAGQAPPPSPSTAPQLIADIYTGEQHAEQRRRARSSATCSPAFSVGYWDGRYGNDALCFCNDADRQRAGQLLPARLQPARLRRRASLALARLRPASSTRP